MSFSGWLLDFSSTVMTHESPLYFTDRHSSFGLSFDLVSLPCVRSDCIESVDREEFTWVFSPDAPEGNCCVFVNDLIPLSGERSICISLLDRVEFTCVLSVGAHGGDLIYRVSKSVSDLSNSFRIDFKLCPMFLLSAFGDFFSAASWSTEEFCVGVSQAVDPRTLAYDFAGLFGLLLFPLI